MTETRKVATWKRPYLAPRVDRTQRKAVEGKGYPNAIESYGGPNSGPS